MTAALFLTSDETNGLAALAKCVATAREDYKQRGEDALAESRTKLSNHEPPGMLATYVAVLPGTDAMDGYMYSASLDAEDA